MQETAIVYNVTIKVADAIKNAWLQWMQTEHIPEVCASGCFTDARMLRLLETDDSEGPTYTVQYFANSKADYNRYISLHADALRQKSFGKWGNQFIAFRTLMEVVR